jgi:hypothetical protein
VRGLPQELRNADLASVPLRTSILLLNEMSQRSREKIMTEPKFPDVYVQLIGSDGSAGAILARVTSAMRVAGVPTADIDAFRLQMFECTYQEFLQLVMETVSVGHPEDFE